MTLRASDPTIATSRGAGAKLIDGTRGLVVERVPERREKIADVLGKVCATLDVAEAPPASSDGIDLVVAGYDSLDLEQRDALPRRLPPGGPTALLLLSEKLAMQDLPRLLLEHRITHLLGGVFDARRLRVTAEKILGRDVFGLRRYFSEATPLVRESTHQSSDKDRLVGLAERFAVENGVAPRMVSLYASVADELLANAIYDAPVDDAGRPRFARLARTEAVTLPETDAAEMQLAFEDGHLGISVSDRFGSLNADHVLARLGRCFEIAQPEQKAGGAGLGLYIAFRSVSHLVINVSRGKRTEIIGLLDARSGYRAFSTSVKSLDVFLAPTATH